MTTTAAIYARISRDEAGLENGVTRQLEDARALAAQRGWGPISSPLARADVVATHWNTYSAGCAEAGRAASGDDWRVAS